ncbi:MAG: ATP-binding protein, partial [Dysgonamonadaceae bacterium]|nr:ATP-binding protein [Dysgonamonadaceae bacterium]
METKVFKKLPYGNSDFRDIRLNNYAYVDKTRYIAQLEQENNRNMFFIRPRKFGKSLLFTTLSYYYDINGADEFEALFGDLYIGQHPTPERNSLAVLKFDFSGLDTKTADRFTTSFGYKVQSCVCDFFDKYSNLIPNSAALIEQLEKDKRGVDSILRVINAAHSNNFRIFILIDEYDHFANDLIALGTQTGTDVYHEMVSANGIVRDFYENIKMGAKDSTFYRTFITGISPIMLDDLTSGYNIGNKLTLKAQYNEMMGFTRQEVEALMVITGVDPKLITIDMEKYYNGYLFSEDGKNRVYNPTMVLYIFSRILEDKKPPEKIIDDNLKTDYGRLGKLTQNDKNRQTLIGIMKDGGIEAPIISQFSLDMAYDDEYFVSQLFYLGLLTIRNVPLVHPFLMIPNYSIQTLYWDYLLKRINNSIPQQNISTLKLNSAMQSLAMEGKVDTFIRYVSETVFSNLSDFDIRNFDEKYIQIMLLAYLFQSGLYIPMSEYETVPGRADIFLQRNPAIPVAKFEWLFEIKYSKVSDSDKDKADIHKLGLEQLAAYCNAKRMQGRPNLKAALLHFTGKDEYEIT